MSMLCSLVALYMCVGLKWALSIKIFFVVLVIAELSPPMVPAIASGPFWSHIIGSCPFSVRFVLLMVVKFVPLLHVVTDIGNCILS